MTNSISRSDYDGYLAAVDRLLAVDGLDSFMQCLTQEIRTLLPFGCMVGGLARISGSQVVPELLLHHDFPTEYLDAIRGRSATLRSPILNKWLKTPVPLAFEFNRRCDQLPSRALAQAKRFDFANVLAHGHYAPTGGKLTYFSFHRMSGPITQDHRVLIARLMPHMHCAVSRFHSRPAPVATSSLDAVNRLAELSLRQQQIASWLIRGKTNWEISQITGTSEANVKYHLSNLMRMYAVSSRSSLVFKLCQATEAPALLSA